MDEPTPTPNRKPELRGVIADLAVCIARSQRVTTWSTLFLSEDHEEVKSTLLALQAELLRVNERVTYLLDYDYTELIEGLRETRDTLRTSLDVTDFELDIITAAMDVLK